MGQLRPMTPGSRMVERTWNTGAFLQLTTIASFAFIVVGAILLSFRPSLLAKFQLHCDGFSRKVLNDIVRVVFLCTAFMIVGPLLVVLNKEILQTLRFDFPLTLAGLGVLTTAIVIRSLVTCRMCEVRIETHEAVAGKAWFQTVLPIAVAKAVTLACGNAVYLHLGLGFIQMLKAFNPVIVVVVMRVCGLAVPCRLAQWGVNLIIFGMLVTINGELHLTLIGVSLMMISEVMEAFNLVLTQKLLQNCNFTLVEGIYMIAPPSGIFLFLAAAVLEWPRMARKGMHHVIVEFPMHFAGSCLLGLAVNFLGMALVQATSGLTVKVLNTIRGIGVICVGVLFYGEFCSNLELLGYSVALGGFSLYNWAQYVESCEPAQEEYPKQAESLLLECKAE